MAKLQRIVKFLLFSACLVLLPLPSLAADDGYGYPIPGSYEATILGTPASLMPEFPAKMRTRQLVLDVIPDRLRPSSCSMSSRTG